MNDFKVNTNNIHYDKIEPFSLNLSESLLIKSNNIFNNNILLTADNIEIFDREYNTLNYLESMNEDFQNENKTFKSEKETLSNSNKVSHSDFKAINKEEIKRQLKLKRNRESAKEGRIRKREFIQNLINENNFLKNKYKILLNIIENCPKCHETFNSNLKNEKKISENENDELNENSKISNKKKFLFATVITIISIINIFNIPLNVISYYNLSYNNKIEYLRNLGTDYSHNITIEKKYTQNLLISKLTNLNGDDEGLYLHFAEFYSINKRETIKTKIKAPEDLKNELNKSIKVFHENKINKDQLNKNYATECIKCIVEIDKNSIKGGGDEFTFYLVNRHLSKAFENKEDGVFPQIDFDENNKKYNSFSKLIALKCKILSYSISDIYSEKI